MQFKASSPHVESKSDFDASVMALATVFQLLVAACKARDEAESQVQLLTKAEFAGDNARLSADNARLSEENTRLSEDNARLVKDKAVADDDLARLIKENGKLAKDYAKLAKEKAQLLDKIKTPRKNPDTSSLAPSGRTPRLAAKKEPQKDADGNPIVGKHGAQPGNPGPQRPRDPRLKEPRHRPPRPKKEAGVEVQPEGASPPESSVPPDDPARAEPNAQPPIGARSDHSDPGVEPQPDPLQSHAEDWFDDQDSDASNDDARLVLRSVENETRVVDLQDHSCPSCGTEMSNHPSRDKEKTQYELKSSPLVNILWILKAYWCPKCKTYHYPDAPREMETGFFGPLLITFICFLKYACRVSTDRIRSLLREMGLSVCKGSIDKNLGKGSAAIEPAYQETKGAIAGEDVLYLDETSHQEQGKRGWTWVVRAKTFILYAIKPDRSAAVLRELLRGFKGIIVCDYYSVYRTVAAELGLTIQFCVAHLKRDIKYLTEFKHKPELVVYGERLYKLLGEILAKYRWYLRLMGRLAPRPKRKRHPREPDYESLDEETKKSMAGDLLVELRQLAERFKAEVLKPPDDRLAKNLAKRFIEYPDSYFTFLSDKGLRLLRGGTNNFAEIGIKVAVLSRNASEGTFNLEGRCRCERFWTVTETCRIQKRSSFEFIRNSILAHADAQEVETGEVDGKGKRIKVKVPNPDRPYPSLIQ